MAWSLAPSSSWLLPPLVESGREGDPELRRGVGKQAGLKNLILLWIEWQLGLLERAQPRGEADLLYGPVFHLAQGT